MFMRLYDKNTQFLISLLSLLIIAGCEKENEDHLSTDDPRPPIEWTLLSSFDGLPEKGEWIDENNLIFLLDLQGGNPGFGFMSTSDGGVTNETWELGSYSYDWGIADMDFVSPSKGWVSVTAHSGNQRDSLLYMTTDGGKSFEGIYRPDTSFVNIHFVNENLGFAITDLNGSNENSIYKTTDGGNSWDFVYHARFWQYNEFFFLNEQVGFAVGSSQSFTAEDGAIIKTTDGGETWQALSISGQPESFNNIYMLNENEGFVLAEGLSWTTDGFSTLQTKGTKKFFHAGEYNQWNSYMDYTIHPLNMEEAYIYKKHDGWMELTTDGFETLNLYSVGAGLHPEWDLQDGFQNSAAPIALQLDDKHSGTMLGNDLFSTSDWSGAFYTFQITE